MKILMINHHRRSKAHLRAGAFSAELAKRGHDVTLLCVAEKENLRFQESFDNGVRWVQSPDLFLGSARSGWDPMSIVRRTGYLAGKDFDLIHAFETRPATIYPVLAHLRRSPKPLVLDWVDWWGRGGLIKENRPRWWQVMFGWMETYYEEAFRTRAHATTVIAKGLRDRAIGLGVPGETISVIYNGAPVEKYAFVGPSEYRQELGLPPDAFIVCDSGRDFFVGCELIMRAVRLASEQIPNIMMIMTGERAKALSQKADVAGLKGRYRHFGFLSDDMLRKALSCANVFVLPFDDRPANRGRWPGKIGKYLATGRPIITNPVGEMKELINQHDVGLLVASSAEGMAEGVIRLYRDENLRIELGNNARRYAETHLRWSVLTNRLLQSYDIAMKRFHGGVSSSFLNKT